MLRQEKRMIEECKTSKYTLQIVKIIDEDLEPKSMKECQEHSD
jgi:hypothetical protein